MQSNAAHDQLSVEWKEFQSAWQDAQAHWKDDVAVQFQKRFISEFEHEVPLFLSNLDTLCEEMKRAERVLRS